MTNDTMGQNNSSPETNIDKSDEVGESPFSPAQLTMSAATKIYLQRQPRVKSYSNGQPTPRKPVIPQSSHLPEPDSHPFSTIKLNGKPSKPSTQIVPKQQEQTSENVNKPTNGKNKPDRGSKTPTAGLNKPNKSTVADKNGRVSVVNSSPDESLTTSPIKPSSPSNNKEKPAPVAVSKPTPTPQKSADLPKKSSTQNNNSRDNSGKENGVNGGTSTAANNNTGGPSSNTGNKPKVTLPYYMEPTFYIGGGNGVGIIEDVCLGMGWKRTKEKGDDGYKLKWCELKSAINYHSFKEGDQLVNHIPNCNLLTNKLGLLNSLQEYDRMALAYRRKVTKLDFIPETFRLDDPRERDVFKNIYKEGDMFICKPTGRNQGKGIFIVKTEEEVKKIFEEQETRTADGKPVKPLNRIIQRYLYKPLLLNKKKFDLRCYMLVASTVPFLVVFHKGYVRLSIHDYDNDTDNLIAHLTNQFIQKKDPTYKDVKEETTWSMEKFNQYVNEVVAPTKDGIEQDWVFNTLTTRMKQIMTYCFNAVKHKLACKIGYFDLYGFDFMVDDDMKVWLIEVNVNPCLAINCEALKEVIPGVVKETIHLAVECFEKSRKGRPLMPLQSLKNFEILVNACPRTGNNGSGKPNRSKSMSPAVTRRSVTKSPMKEPAIVSASIDVSRNENPRFNFQQNRGNTMMGRRVGVNTPRATVTTIPDNTIPDNGLNPVKTGQQRFTKSGGTSSTNHKSDIQAPASRTDSSDKNKNRNNNDSSASNNNALKLTTFKMPDENKEPSDSSKPSKTAEKAPYSTTSIGKSLTIGRQNTDLSHQKSSKQVGLPPGTKKLQYRGLKREPTISVKVITKESNSKLPSETKIVIVDNKSNTEITDSNTSIKHNNSNSNNSGSGISRSAYIDSSMTKNSKNSSPQLRTKSETTSPTEQQDRSSSTAKSGRKSTTRSSPTKGTKSPEKQPSENLVSFNDEVESTKTRNGSSKNRVNTPHGTSLGVGANNNNEGMPPVDPALMKPSTRYAVFPLSPYKQPVAQLKMTHKSNKKSKSRASVEIGNRGS